jgi:hypothetical protein
MGKWQSIETAPHDEYILLGWWDDGVWNSTTGRASHGWRRGSISTMSRHGQATHWMALPPPPPGNASEPDHGEDLYQAERAFITAINAEE